MNKAKVKKVLNIIVNVLLWIFVAFAALMTIVAIAATSNAENIPMIGGKYLLTVQSDSMKPEFKEGDLIFSKALTDEEKLQLKEEDVITFYYRDINGDGKEDLNTHRIVKVNTVDGVVVSYDTQGDNREMSAVPETISVSDVKGIWTGGKMSGVGGLINFMQKPTGFLCVIVLPLGLLFFYQIFIFARAVVRAKNSGKRQITAADEELIKQRAVEEFLRAQAEKNAEAASDGASADEETPPKSSDGASTDEETPPKSADGDESGDDKK